MDTAETKCFIQVDSQENQDLETKIDDDSGLYLMSDVARENGKISSGKMDDGDDETDKEDEVKQTQCCCFRFIDSIEDSVSNLITQNRTFLRNSTFIIVSALYLVYVGYALNYRFGDEGSIRLLSVTILAVVIIVLKNIKRLKCVRDMQSSRKEMNKSTRVAKVKKIIRW